MPTAGRTAFLTQACAGDAGLLRRVEALLQAHEEAGSFLGASPLEALQARERTQLAGPALLPEALGDRIGRYKLLQKIGEGGCGVVYMAEQEEPVRRRVALKVIKLGMDTKEVIARFEAERQALALMDHPNIAKVFDAGATDAGRPFFVMELVRGVPVTKYCDEENLPTAARLELFTQVCHAVQHAHQKGIIHRDLKPSNILVTLHDGVPVPKVIDFGIAKATQGRLTDSTVFTAFEQFIGTPAYMSPEQAELSGLDIDTRSDIYSLGVLLYELLTGRPPFDPKTFVRAGLDEMRRIIREVEPPKPSTRLNTLTDADRSMIAKLRGTGFARLSTLLRGDLDWIVMKAIEKNRTRRYDTANSLADDIQRHLHDKPVAARPPNKFYLFQKLLARHRFAVAAAAAVAAALVLGLGVSTWEYFREKAARERAVAAEQRAKAEAIKSKQVAQFLKDMLEGVGPSVALGRDPTLLREILDKTTGRLGQSLKDQPEVEAELRATLGAVYRELGEFEKAEAMFRETLRLQQAALGPEHLDVAVTTLNLVKILAERGDVDGADVLFRAALVTRQKLPASGHPAATGIQDNPPAPSRINDLLADFERVQHRLLVMRRQQQGAGHPDVAKTLSSLGAVSFLHGDSDEAEALLREALATQRKLLGNEHPDVATSLMNLGMIALSRSDYPAAETAWGEALAIQRRLHGREHPEVAKMLMNLGALAFSRGDYAAAEKIWKEAVAMQRRLSGDEHPDTVMLVMNFGALALAQGQPAEAERIFREVLAKHRKLYGDQSPYVAGSLENLGEALAAKGDPAEAETFFRETLALRRKLFGDRSAEVAETLGSLGEVSQALHQWAEAEALQREALSIQGKTEPDDWQGFNLRSQLGASLAAQKKFPEAEPLLLTGYEGMMSREGKIRSDSRARYLPQALAHLVQLYTDWGQPGKAAEWQLRLQSFKTPLAEKPATDKRP